MYFIELTVFQTLCRKWRPSEWILEDTVEITVPHNFLLAAEELVLEKVSSF